MAERETPFVSVDIRLKFGQPCLHGRRLPAEMIAERYWELGAQLREELLDAYDITRADVVICCWYVAQHGSRTWRKRWRPWVDTTWRRSSMTDATGWYSADFADVELPPFKGQEQP